VHVQQRTVHVLLAQYRVLDMTLHDGAATGKYLEAGKVRKTRIQFQRKPAKMHVLDIFSAFQRTKVFSDVVQ